MHLIVAVKRKYESVRRLWLAEGKEDFEETSKLECIKKKNRQRRQRVYRDYWAKIEVMIMFVYRNLTAESV